MPTLTKRDDMTQNLDKPAVTTPRHREAADACEEQMAMALAISKLSDVRRALAKAIAEPSTLGPTAAAMARQLMQAAEVRCAELDARLLDAQRVVDGYLGGKA